MPSDARITGALDAVRAPIDGFVAAVAAARGQVGDYLETHRSPAADRTQLAATALGQFAGGRLDAGRFAATFEGTRILSVEDAERIAACVRTLEAVAEEGDAAFTCRVERGASMEEAIDLALARFGRAFGAVLAFQAVKAGTYHPDSHGDLLDRFPFARWNRAERMLAPPLVVDVEGPDVDAAQLARFVDGRVRLVVVPRGATAPAALAPLVTPGTFVMQTSDAADLGRASAAAAPAVAMVVDASAARFVHDPAGGPRIADRLTVQAMPAEPPRAALPRCSVAQQREALGQLETLAAAARTEGRLAASDAIAITQAVAVSAAAGNGEAVDTLAGWLLSQAGMTEGVAR